MKKLLTGAAITAVITGAVLAGAPTAFAANGINGRVSCVQGNSVTKPVGVWIDYDNSKGNFSTIWSNGPKATWAEIAYSATVAVNTFHLHIGCGGTSQSWGTTVFIDKPPGNFGTLRANW